MEGAPDQCLAGVRGWVLTPFSRGEGSPGVLLSWFPLWSGHTPRLPTPDLLLSWGPPVVTTSSLGRSLPTCCPPNETTGRTLRRSQTDSFRASGGGRLDNYGSMLGAWERPSCGSRSPSIFTKGYPRPFGRRERRTVSSIPVSGPTEPSPAPVSPPRLSSPTDS